MAEPVKPSLPPPSDDLATRIAVAVAEAVAGANAKQFGPQEVRFRVEPTRPKLNGEFYLSGGPLKPQQLSDAEIVALNKITVPGRYHGGKWIVRIRKDQDKTVTTIDVPCKTIDQRMELPNSLIGILSEIEAEAAKAK
jgi:hypothetical protein